MHDAPSFWQIDIMLGGLRAISGTATGGRTSGPGISVALIKHVADAYKWPTSTLLSARSLPSVLHRFER
ncbi:MAG: hypothetical protein WCJ13_09780 [Coriobacteriia bacterium]